jgi:acetoin utilization deacetylase AcuC-like enzyme
LAGGTHHAHAAFGAGYCVFNDIAVASRALLDAGEVERVLVFDVDVHQGDGTAAIFAEESRVFTCSVHGARNFPARKAVSDLDVELADGTEDEAYLRGVAESLESALDRVRPDVVFVQAGVDPLVTDRLGRLAVSREGLYERDRLVLATLLPQAPVVLTLGGGYARPIEDTIAAHVGTYRAVRAVARELRLSPPGSGGG